MLLHVVIFLMSATVLEVRDYGPCCSCVRRINLCLKVGIQASTLKHYFLIMSFLKSSANLRILGEKIDPPFERDCMCIKLKQHEKHMVRLTENEDHLCRYPSKKGLKIE